MQTARAKTTWLAAHHSFFSWIRKSCLFPAELLHSQNIIHLRLRQKEALHAVSKDVLRQQRRHRRLPQQENKGHLQTFEKKAVPQKCRPWVYSPSNHTPTMLLRLLTITNGMNYNFLLCNNFKWKWDVDSNGSFWSLCGVFWRSCVSLPSCCAQSV